MLHAWFKQWCCNRYVSETATAIDSDFIAIFRNFQSMMFSDECIQLFPLNPGFRLEPSDEFW